MTTLLKKWWGTIRCTASVMQSSAGPLSQITLNCLSIRLVAHSLGKGSHWFWDRSKTSFFDARGSHVLLILSIISLHGHIGFTNYLHTNAP